MMLALIECKGVVVAVVVVLEVVDMSVVAVFMEEVCTAEWQLFSNE